MASTRTLLMLGVALAAVGCTEQVTKQAEVRPVRTMVVDLKPVEDDRRAVGEVRPRHESDLGFRVSGKVVSRHADVGASVKKGDVLARLDSQDYRNRLTSAEADVAAAEAVLVEAASAEERLHQLLVSGTTTRANYDAVLKNLRSAEAKLGSAKAALNLANDQLAYSQLVADFDGVVTAVAAEPGQVVNVGQTIVRLARPDAKDAVFAIAEAAFEGRAGNEPAEIVVSLLSNPDVRAEGLVREVSPVADQTTRTYQVKVTLKSPPEQMRFGASVVGRLKASSTPVAVLPGSALFDKDGQPAVWVLDAADASVKRKAIVIARYETDKVIVSGGLTNGDVIVTAGVNRLRDNQRVRLAEGGRP